MTNVASGESAGPPPADQGQRPPARDAADRPPGPGGGGPGGRDDRPPWRVEGARTPDGERPTPPQWSRIFRRLWWVILIVLVVNWLFASAMLGPRRTTVSYTFFRQQVQAGNVKEITSTGDSIEGEFRTKAAYPPGEKDAKQVTQFTTQRPAFADDALVQLLLSKNVTVNAKPPDRVPLWQQLLIGFGPALLFLALIVWFYRRAAGGGGLGGLGGLGRSRARRYEPESGPRTTFADVAGIDEVKNEVSEIVDFLREPEKYRRIGATIPKGVLLSGPPGTGKTLLARAVAGEARCRSISSSASEFVEFIVGVGAARVRDLFEQAKKAAPAIIFLDELDAIGRARGGAQSLGGEDEREQTLNQILTEMDGFSGTEGVVVLAATNRPEILDPALLRPGRFDRRVVISPPDLDRSPPDPRRTHSGRPAGTRRRPRGARHPPRPAWSAPTWRNLVNEAALLAARRGQDRVSDGGLRRRAGEDRPRRAAGDHAIRRAPPDRLPRVRSRAARHAHTRRRSGPEGVDHPARHGAGRDVPGTGGRPLRLLGDVPARADHRSPRRARRRRDRVQRRHHRRRERLDQVTGIARQMVGRWGMSGAVGRHRAAASGPGVAAHWSSTAPPPATSELLDREVRRIVDECHDQAVATLVAHREQLDRLAQALFAKETLNEDEAYAAAGVPRTTGADLPSPTAAPRS